MKKNRIFYILFLLAMILFYAFYEGWFSLFALWITLLLPVFSLLISLPLFRKASIKLHGQTSLTTEDHFVLYASLSNRTSVPVSSFKITLETEDVLSSEHKRQNMTLTGTGSEKLLEADLHAGVYHFRAVRCRTTDILGLFAVPFSSSASFGVTVNPVKKQPEPVPDLESLRPVRFVPSPSMGFSENTDLRSYHPGDPMRSVHWKLSQKTEELLVRQPLDTVMKRIYVILSSDSDRAALDHSFGEFLWLSGKLLAMEVPFIFLYLTDRPGDERHISSEEDLKPVINSLLITPAKKPEDPEALVIPDADRIFYIPERRLPDDLS
ncbi:MAG: DUF58 domain-containing protein [Lachnospiraceae bacterium]|nr:DUF58 domain-containing protein [Lachnospiraceae bacterium]